MALHPRKIEYRDPATLQAYGRNARTHSDAQIDEIAASIQQLQFNAPIALKDDGVTIGAGHGRQLAALRILADPAKWGPLNTPDGKTVPTMVLKGLSEAQWRAYIIADNRIAERAGWDFDILKQELADIGALDAMLPNLAGFSDAEITALLRVEPPPSLDDLAKQFGKPAASDFWPEIKVKVPPKVHKLFESLMAQARPAGEDEWQRLEAVLSAVDTAALPQ